MTLAKDIRNRSAAARLSIAESNIRYWLKREQQIRDAPRHSCVSKTRRIAKHPGVDTKVCTFVNEKIKNGLGVTRNLI